MIPVGGTKKGDQSLRHHRRHHHCEHRNHGDVSLEHCYEVFDHSVITFVIKVGDLNIIVIIRVMLALAMLHSWLKKSTAV